jgi:transcriptional regulator with XRE-family HTH domain
METVGKRLQYVRTKQGLTLDQVAERAGISKSFLSEVEHGRSGIASDKLLRLANALGASLNFLFQGSDPPEAFEPPNIEIPHELGETAEELGLSYQQTLALLDVENSIVARRSSKVHGRKSKEQWRVLYDGIKDSLEEGHEQR